MRHPRYYYQSEDSWQLFEFISEGPKGPIRKIVEYTPTGTENVYNLGFGDFDEVKNGINDLAVTNNGDSLKVLATVAATVYAFIENHPAAWVFATGSTVVRTRLYRMGITNNLVEIAKDFIILGYKSTGDWEDFVVGEDYEAFLLTTKRKQLII
jgi:hypothetical protein